MMIQCIHVTHCCTIIMIQCTHVTKLYNDNNNYSMPTGYIVEKKKLGGDWEKVNTFPSAGEKMTVPDLEEGETYEFRVAAVTKAGPGDNSLPTSPTVVKEPEGGGNCLIVSFGVVFASPVWQVTVVKEPEGGKNW